MTLDGNQSAEALVFNVTNSNGYTLTQGTGGALSLGTSAGAAMTVTSGAHVISAPMSLEGNLSIGIAGGAAVDLSGVVDQAALLSPFGVSLNGPGLLNFGGTGAWSGDTSVNSGTLEIDAGGLLPANNEYVGTGGTAATVVQNGGSNIVSASGNSQGLIVGYGSGNAYYTLNGGLVNAANEFVGYSGNSVFTQSGGTNTVATNLTVGSLGGGQYTMSAGVLSAANAYVGNSGIGNVLQSGGDVSLSTALFLAYQNGSQGNYNLSGTGRLSAPNEYIGYGGIGTFNQSGGTNSLPGGNLYLGFNPSSMGTYNLSGGVLKPVNEYVGGGGVFYQTGGTNTTTNISVSGGYYLLTAGQIQGAGGGTIGVVNGGFQSLGTLDLSGYAAVVAGTGALLDLSGNVLSSSGASLSVGPDSLLIVPPGFNSANYASYSNQGMLHTLGSTLSVSAGTGFGGWGDIVDPVACQGTILATQGGWINLYNGLSLAGSGQVNVGTGSLIVNDTNFSGMTGPGVPGLAASLLVVGSNGTGSFAQSGGSSAISTLYLADNGGDSGTYLLGGAARLSVGYEIVGIAGSGVFTQTGGTHAAGTLYLAQGFTSAGTYNLAGGLLSLSSLYQGGGAAAFNFSGGTFQAAAPSTYVFMPVSLSAPGNSGDFDTNGNSLALYGSLSGPGGLIVTGSGKLTLGVSNSFAGTSLVSNGTLMLSDSRALSGSTFDASGTGALSFQAGIGGFAIGGLQGSGSLLMTDTLGNDLALTVGGNDFNTTFSGSLSDGGPPSGSGGTLTKVGTGTLILSGTNAFRGGTKVEDGTLIVTNSMGLANGSSLTVGDPTPFSAPIVPSAAIAVPEPSAFALLAVGLWSAAAYRLFSARRNSSATRIG